MCPVRIRAISTSLGFPEPPHDGPTHRLVDADPVVGEHEAEIGVGGAPELKKCGLSLEARPVEGEGDHRAHG